MSAHPAHLSWSTTRRRRARWSATICKLHGFEVTLCDGGKSLREAIARQSPDLIVLDLNMPEEDGLSIVRALKQHGRGADHHADRDREPDRPRGRARARRRRLSRQALRAARAPGARPLGAAPERGGAAPRQRPRRRATASAPIRFGTKWLDVDAQVLRDEDGNEHPLASSEFALLKAFAENPKRVLSRERLLDLAEARDREAFDRAIDVRITRIRRKIEPDPAHPTVIRTVRGAGYLFSPDGSGSGGRRLLARPDQSMGTAGPAHHATKAWRGW